MTIAIRDLTRYDEFLAVRDIQQQCWGFTQGEGLYPPLLNTAAHNGGVVLGAFDADRMIGFLFGFLGLHAGRRLKLCSQTMGVLPEYRNRGVAAALKWAQRERVQALDIDLITWTYDPLEAPNARLNLHTLGAIAREYRRNIYGENFGALGHGLPSDRFTVEWWIASRRVERRASGLKPEPTSRDSPIANPCSGAGLERQIESVQLDFDTSEVWVEIPIDIQAVKQADMALALDWRLKARQIFEAYFERGYEAVDVLKVVEGETQQNFYVLRRADQIETQPSPRAD
jgi:predicted GNAT superfamily acetyltransferase